MNVCTFSGRIGRDPEIRHTNGGDVVLSWPLAVDTGSKDKPATMWLECSLWGRRAESLSPYIRKGDKLTVSGRLAQEEYQAKDGTTKSKLRLSVDQVELPPKAQGDAPAPAPAAKKTTRPIEDWDNDLPF